MLLRNRRGQNIDIVEPHFNEGGEGYIHDVAGDRSVVAKIYKPPGRTAEREQKLLAMLSRPPTGDVAKQIAWPTEVLYSQSGQFLGFVMPRIVDSIEISEIYSYDNRNRYYYSFFIQVAQNLCAAVDAVHSSGHVCGDLNHANIYVNPTTALVTMVDTDSYHVNVGGGKAFKCPVCMPEYAPVEIGKLINSGENLRTTRHDTFSKYTDYFMLAIHIFKLLMNGAHPYACSITNPAYSGSQFTLEQNIMNGVFPYNPSETRVSPPKYAVDIASLPDSLVEKFSRSFESGKYSYRSRCTPEQWHDELKKLEAGLVGCYKNPKHYYYNKNKKCPLCESEKRMQSTATVRRAMGVKVSNLTQQIFKPPRGRPISLNIFAFLWDAFMYGLYWVWTALVFVVTLPLKLLTMPNSAAFGYLLGGAMWLSLQGLLFYAVSFLPSDSFWWWLLRVAILAAAPFGMGVIYAFFDGYGQIAVNDTTEAIGNVFYVGWILPAVAYPIYYLIAFFVGDREGDFFSIDGVFSAVGGFFGDMWAYIVWWFSGQPSDSLPPTLTPTPSVAPLPTPTVAPLPTATPAVSEGWDFTWFTSMFDAVPMWIVYGVLAVIAIGVIYLLRESFITGMIVGLALWAGGQWLGILFVTNMGIDAWWGWFVGIALFGLIPYIPLWICFVIDEIFLPINDLWEGIALTMNWSFYIGIVCYGVGAIITLWDTGLVNIVLNTVLICTPMTFMYTKFPDATFDLL